MASRYWVGGTAAWDVTAGTKWAEISGGPGGFSVPTTADDVFFDAASSGTCSINAGNTGAQSLDCTGFTGTIAGTGALIVSGSITLASTLSWTHTGTITVTGTGTLITAGKTLGAVTINGAGITVQLGDALNIGVRVLTVTAGTFTTNSYSFIAGSISSLTANTRAINLGSSTVSLSGSVPINFAQFAELTFNAGTSQINSSLGTTTLNGGVTFYNFTYTTVESATVNGANTFNNLTVAARTTAGISTVTVASDQTINGTLTLSPSTFAAARTFVQSSAVGATRTLTCAAVATLTDIDFRDITVAGAAAPVSGTRLGDGKGNTGITFDAPKTVYWRESAGGFWGSIVAARWAATDGGTADATLFPLAQDTAVFPSAYPNSGATVTVNAAYNIGAVDLSARTANTMTLSCVVVLSVYGDWTNGTGVTFAGAGAFAYAGRSTQTITSAGRTFTQRLTVSSPGGTVQLADAFTSSSSSVASFSLTHGTFVANDYSVTLTGVNSGVLLFGVEAKALSVGSGAWTISGTNGWFADATALTLSGTAAISLTSASSKTFAGGGVQTYPTVNQGGTGTLTISGSNKFANLTNTAIGRIQFTGGTVNEFDAFSINGVSGSLLPVGSTNTTPAVLTKLTTWNVGANSTDAGNNTGLSFTGTDPDFLSISYITGVAAGAMSVGAVGSGATTAVGSVQIVATARVEVAGVVAQTQSGTVGVVISGSVSAVGVQAQTQLGSLTVTLGAGVPATGVQAQAQLGSVAAGAVNARVPVSGVYAVGLVGTTLVWGLVNDTQPADWHNINDTQDPGWVPIVNAQPPEWSPVD